LEKIIQTGKDHFNLEQKEDSSGSWIHGRS